MIAWWHRLTGAGFALLVCVALSYPYTWYVKSQRDQEWVDRLREARGRVTEVIRQGNIVLEALDQKAMEDLDAARKRTEDELAELKRRQTVPLSEACNSCRIPSYRLWLQQ